MPCDKCKSEIDLAFLKKEVENANFINGRKTNSGRNFV